MEIITTQNAPAAISPCVQGVSAGKMVITSGQVPVDPQTVIMSDAIEVQTHQSLENVRVIVEAAGLTAGKIIKTTVFVKDLNDFPARSCVEVAACRKTPGLKLRPLPLPDAGRV